MLEPCAIDDDTDTCVVTEDLEGLKVSHDFEGMEDGEERILTLKDSRILEDEGEWISQVSWIENTHMSL